MPKRDTTTTEKMSASERRKAERTATEPVGAVGFAPVDGDDSGEADGD